MTSVEQPPACAAFRKGSRRFEAARLPGAARPEGEREAEAVVHAERAVDRGAQEGQKGEARRDERGVERGAEGLERREAREVGRLVRLRLRVRVRVGVGVVLRVRARAR